MTTKQKMRSPQKPAKGARSDGLPIMALRIRPDRLEAIDRKAEELGGMSRSAVVKLALKKYGI